MKTAILFFGAILNLFAAIFFAENELQKTSSIMLFSIWCAISISTINFK